MESWGYAPEGRSFLFTDELNLAVDSFVRDGKLPGWDPKACDIEAVESMDFMDLGLADVARRSFHYNSPTEMLFGDVGYDSSNPVASPSCMVTSVSYFGEDESRSRHSGSLFESNSQESSLIDLKLGRVADYPDAKAAKILQDRLVSSTAQHHTQAKRARVVSSFSQTPYCQVHGCNKDLSSSKDYHRRHRVCDVHAKTAKVIVSGIEQRFCQQCSRFHLVTEFDDGKRSCRKRLAGHNERRRKLHLNAFSGKHHKLLLSYHGGVSYHERHGHANQYQWVKDEVEPVFDPTASVLISDEKWFPKSSLQMQESWKEYGGFPSLVEDYKVANYAACDVKGFTVSSSYNRALSLLSNESELRHMLEEPVKRSVFDQGSYVDNVVGKPPWLGSLSEYPGNGFNSHGKVMHSQELVHQHLSGVSAEHASTVDLLQLSSHLQRVEQQRNFIQLQLQN